MILFNAKVYSETSQISKMEFYAKVDNSWKPLTISAKSFMLDVWLGCLAGFWIRPWNVIIISSWDTREMTFSRTFEYFVTFFTGIFLLRPESSRLQCIQG